MSGENQSTMCDYSVTLKSEGNPEGKGVDAFMLDWQQSEPTGAVAKPRQQVLADFFTSMLVLSSTFKFRPVVGSQHYLYWIDGQWSLSLIAPDEWSEERRAAFVGTCVLHEDKTWTIEPSESLVEDRPVADALRRFYDAFALALDTDRTLEEMLPFYNVHLPYYQRLYASALSRSLRTSVTAGQQCTIKGKAWRSLLLNRSGNLLEHRHTNTRSDSGL